MWVNLFGALWSFSFSSMPCTVSSPESPLRRLFVSDPLQCQEGLEEHSMRGQVQQLCPFLVSFCHQLPVLLVSQGCWFSKQNTGYTVKSGPQRNSEYYFRVIKSHPYHCFPHLYILVFLSNSTQRNDWYLCLVRQEKSRGLCSWESRVLLLTGSLLNPRKGRKPHFE